MEMFDQRGAGRDWHYREAPVRLMSAGRSYNTELSELRRFDDRVCLCQ
jgi:hypothetical protein